MEEEKKCNHQWFNTWTLVLLVLFFWPGAIIYMIFKNAERNEGNCKFCETKREMPTLKNQE